MAKYFITNARKINSPIVTKLPRLKIFGVPYVLICLSDNKILLNKLARDNLQGTKLDINALST